MRGNTLIECFSEVTDPRLDRRKKHKLIDVIAITVCAVVSGAETWVEIEQFGNERLQWLSQFLELANGIPSHDTFARVFSILDPKAFERAFYQWASSIHQPTKGNIIAVDGKCLKGTVQYSPIKKLPIHMVSAWATESGLVLAQAKAHTKDAHEKDVMSNLLDELFIKDTIVTLDAMGADKTICKKIVAKGADYLIALKRNQRALYDAVEATFKEQSSQHNYQTDEVNRDRQEHRACSTLKATSGLSADLSAQWPGLTTIVKIETKRTYTETRTQINAEKRTDHEVRYYITSLADNPKEIAHAARSHWAIENGLHWKLDVCFREDDCRVRIKNAAENFAVVRHIALNLLNQEKTQKKSMRRKRLLAGWNQDYLGQVVFNQPI